MLCAIFCVTLSYAEQPASNAAKVAAITVPRMRRLSLQFDKDLENISPFTRGAPRSRSFHPIRLVSARDVGNWKNALL
jgi:hypothetical protein